MSVSRPWSGSMSHWWRRRPGPSERRAQKKEPAPELFLAQAQEIQQLMARFEADGSSYQKAENPLLERGGLRVGARQIQRLIQQVGKAAQAW
jgi:hypothetical protein